MTLSNVPAKEIKNGNDSTVVFSFTFVINTAADMVVTHTDAAGVETVITEGTGTTNYSISVTNYPGNGSITYPATLGTELATGASLTLARVVDLDQETDLQNQAQYKPETVESAFDYSRMIDLQQQDQLDRSLKVAISDASGADFTIPAPVAGAIIGAWNATGDAIVAGPAAGSIAGAQGFATAAEASSVAAAASEAAAGVSETNAAASAVDAAASAASADVGDINGLATATPAMGDEAAFADVSDSNTVKKSTWTAIWTMFLGVASTWNSAQRAGETVLTTASNSIATDLALSNDFTHTLSENTTLANPTNVVAGQSGAIRFTQDAATARTIAYGSYFKFDGGTAPTAPTTLSSKFTLYYYVRSATEIECTLTGEYS